MNLGVKRYDYLRNVLAEVGPKNHGGEGMQIVSTRSETIDIDEFLARPLFAHLSTSSEHGARDVPLWTSRKPSVCSRSASAQIWRSGIRRDSLTG